MFSEEWTDRDNKYRKEDATWPGSFDMNPIFGEYTYKALTLPRNETKD